MEEAETSAARILTFEERAIARTVIAVFLFGMCESFLQKEAYEEADKFLDTLDQDLRS